LSDADSVAAESEVALALIGRVDISASCLTSWLRVIGTSFNRSVVPCQTKIDLHAHFFKTPREARGR
jgi:hypothetical protein